MERLTPIVYALTYQIPKGKVTTYGALSKAISGNTHLSRIIGTILSKNTYNPVVPCHRVVKSTGHVGGFFGSNENMNKKEELLIAEGVPCIKGVIPRFKEYLFTDFFDVNYEEEMEEIVFAYQVHKGVKKLKEDDDDEVEDDDEVSI